MYEKRVHIRIPTGIEGSYQPVTRLAIPRTGITRDISQGGVRFASMDRLEPGEKISLVLSLPEQGDVALTGMVVWSRMQNEGVRGAGYEAGLSWQNVDAHAQARLNSFLINHARPEPVIITSGPAAPQFSWVRVGLFAAIVSFLLWTAAAAYLALYQLRSENRALQSEAQSSQHLIDHVSLHSR